MEFTRKTLKVILSVSLIFYSGCTLYNEGQQTGSSDFSVNEHEEERNGEKSTFFEEISVVESAVTTAKEIKINDETIFSAFEDNISIDEPDSSTDITDKSVDNWLLDGFVVPENWQEVLTTKEAFESFDLITASLPEGASLEDEIVLLMNRNILCFDTKVLQSFELVDHISSGGGKSEMILGKVYSDYFKSVQDIKKLYHQTFTEAYAHYLFYGTEDKPQQIFIRDEEGILWVNMEKVGNWATDPFRDRSYIEIVDHSESICEFLWHYVSYDYGDYFTDYLPHEFFPFHHTINGFAVNENGEWRLAYLILDNPELNRPTFKWRPVGVS